MQVNITSAEIQTQFFMAVLILAILLFINKRGNPVSFDLKVTNELKGLAILMIIFAHIGYFLVSDHRFLFPLSVGGGIGVNLFFYLSGYGLSVSFLKKTTSILNFYKKKIVRLFIPLWIILLTFIVADYLFLSRIYNFNEIIQSFLGYFPRADLIYSINSPLWFITPILFYYLLFPLIFNRKYLFLSGIFLMAISYFLLFNSAVNDLLINNKWVAADVLRLYKTHFMAFPLGIITADLITNKAFTKNIWNFFAEKLRDHSGLGFFIRAASLLIALYVAWYTAIYSGIGKPELIEQYISLITIFSFVFVFIFNFFKFRLLGILGIFSYEIYLLHWPILSRFDILYKNLPPVIATSFYLGLFLLLGFLLNKFSNLITGILLSKEQS